MIVDSDGATAAGGAPARGRGPPAAGGEGTGGAAGGGEEEGGRGARGEGARVDDGPRGAGDEDGRRGLSAGLQRPARDGHRLAGDRGRGSDRRRNRPGAARGAAGGAARAPLAR